MSARQAPPRDALDRYYTPDALARQLVYVLSGVNPEVVVEPSVGDGAFARAVRARWPSAYILGVDAAPTTRAAECVDDLITDDWPVTALSVLGQDPAFAVDLVVGNPPYRYAEQHIGVALALRPKCAAFLLRLGFLAGAKHAAFWRENPPSEVHVLSKRPSFTGDGRTDGSEYGWFVWCDLLGPVIDTPELHWISPPAKVGKEAR